MNEFLAQFYGTGKTASVSAPVISDEDLEKQASVDMFMKVASENEIPLDTMADADVQYLYGEFMKAAGENPFAKKDEKSEEEKDKEEKEAAAMAEFESRKEASNKVAEADYLGRVMAHSFTQELGNITKEAKGGYAAGEAISHLGVAADKLRGAGKHVAEKAREAGHRGKDLLKGDTAKKLTGIAKEETAAAHLYGTGGVPTQINQAARTERLKSHAARAGVAATAAGGAVAAHHYAKKHSSAAFDEVAGEQAVTLAVQCGWDTDQAVNKIAAVLELGFLGESEKVASAADYPTSVNIRALEMLEAAGYPVTWQE
jgi:hypothetical protein